MVTTAVPSQDVTYLAAGDVDLSGAWDELWSAVSGEISGLLNIITIVGIILVVGSIIVYFWQKRRGGQLSQGGDTVMWVMVLGAVLCAPQIIFPLILALLDQVINALVNIGNRGD